MLAEGVPGDAVEIWELLAVDVGVREQRDAPGGVLLIQVDASHVPVGRAFVSLEEVVVTTHGEVHVLVGLGLESFLGVLRERTTPGGDIAVVGHASGQVGVGQRHVAPSHGSLRQPVAQDVVLHTRTRVGGRHAPDAEP